MRIPEKYVIEAYHRLGFSERPDENPQYRIFTNNDDWMFFHQVLEDGLMELDFIVLDIEGTEGPLGMDVGWARNVWLPTLQQVVEGTEYGFDLE